MYCDYKILQHDLEPDYIENETEIIFGHGFDKNIDYLPVSTKKLTLGMRFNKNVDYLPINVNYLEFRGIFNKNVDHLPPKIKTIIFGYAFNKTVNYLPECVEELYFGTKFNKRVDYLPQSVKHITFGCNFDKTICYLPKSVKNLIFDEMFCNKIFNDLHKLQISDSYVEKLRYKIKHITILVNNHHGVVLCNKPMLIWFLNILPIMIKSIWLDIQYKLIYHVPLILKNLPFNITKFSHVHEQSIKIPYGCELTTTFRTYKNNFNSRRL